MTQDGDLITSAEAAVILHESVRTTHRRVASGRLVPAQKVQAGRHGTYLFHKADIEALAAREATEVPA